MFVLIRHDDHDTHTLNVNFINKPSALESVANYLSDNWFYRTVVSTVDSESANPGSIPGRTIP